MGYVGCELRKGKSMKTEQINVNLDMVTLDAVDAWRRKQKNPPSQPEAIRKLVEISLSNLGKFTIPPVPMALDHHSDLVELEHYFIELIKSLSDEELKKLGFKATLETIVRRGMRGLGMDMMANIVDRLEITKYILLKRNSSVRHNTEAWGFDDFQKAEMDAQIKALSSWGGDEFVIYKAVAVIEKAEPTTTPIE